MNILPEHYTTAYDLYLISNEAMKYDKFLELIHTATYTSTYRDRNNNEKSIDIQNSNAYIKGEAFAPENVTVIGGKTGTTSAAGNCLILLLQASTHTKPIHDVLIPFSFHNYFIDFTTNTKSHSLNCYKITTAIRKNL